MVTLFMLLKGNAAIEPVLALASFVVAGGIVVFAVVLWKHTAAAVPATQPVGTAAV